MITELDTPERVHYAMLRGTIATISLRQCAHIHGTAALEAFNRWDELRGDIKLTSDVLIDFPGEHVWQQAQAAVTYIDWLKMELKISKYNERAALDVLAQSNRHLHGGSCNDDEERKTSGPAGEKQERTQHGAGSQGHKG